MNQSDSEQKTPLMHLCDYDLSVQELQKRLIKIGVIIDLEDSDDDYDIDITKYNKKYEAALSLLIKSGADVNAARENDGLTPLFFALKNRNRNLGEILLKTRQVDLNHQDNSGNYALALAMNNHHHILHILLSQGSNINSLNSTGTSHIKQFLSDQNGKMSGPLIEHNVGVILQHYLRLKNYGFTDKCSDFFQSTLDTSEFINYLTLNQPSSKLSLLIFDDPQILSTNSEESLSKIIAQIPTPNHNVVSQQKYTDLFSAIKDYKEFLTSSLIGDGHLHYEDSKQMRYYINERVASLFLACCYYNAKDYLYIWTTSSDEEKEFINENTTLQGAIKRINYKTPTQDQIDKISEINLRLQKSGFDKITAHNIIGHLILGDNLSTMLQDCHELYKVTHTKAELQQEEESDIAAPMIKNFAFNRDIIVGIISEKFRVNFDFLNSVQYDEVVRVMYMFASEQIENGRQKYREGTETQKMAEEDRHPNGIVVPVEGTQSIQQQGLKGSFHG